MDAELRRKVCRLVAGLVVSDDDFAPEEEAFIDRMLARFEIGEREAIFPIVAHDEAEAEMRALPADVQRETLELLLEAAVADGRIADGERDYLRVVGRVMGLDADAVERRIDVALASRAR